MDRLRPLRKHQREAFAYTKHVRHPALFMEMRLGKTLVCIRRILTYKKSPLVLVFAPNSALGSWEDELDMEGVMWARLNGSKKVRQRLLSEWVGAQHEGSGPLFILTNKEAHLSIGAELAGVRWTAVVLDESHYWKSAKAKITKYALKAFQYVPHRWILTGTPNPEDDSEFFTQMQFLHGEFMGYRNFYQWRSFRYQPHPAGFGWTPRPGTRKAIRREVGLRSFVLRRQDAGLDRDKIHEVRWLEFDSRVRRMYDKLERQFVLDLDGDERETMFAGERYQWLRQLCGGILKDGSYIHEMKLKILCELLGNELSQEPVVVWFAYNAEIERAARALAKVESTVQAITGAVKDDQRESIRRAYMRGDVRVLLMQQAIAQTGMNLSRGDIAIYASHPAGYMAWRQTQDRVLTLDRTGSILYVHLLVRDSVDEDLYLALQDKRVRSEYTLQQALRVRMEERTSHG